MLTECNFHDILLAHSYCAMEENISNRRHGDRRNSTPVLGGALLLVLTSFDSINIIVLHMNLTLHANKVECVLCLHRSSLWIIKQGGIR